MGQLALGFRSLLIKAAIFFVMALLLAWALGGTLWPRAQRHDLPSVTHHGARWFWRISVGGLPDEHLRWQLMKQSGDKRAEPVDDRIWKDVTDLLERDGSLYYGGLIGAENHRNWYLEKRTENLPVEVFSMPDRLALEQQMARIKSGLPIQSAAQIHDQRPVVLDPRGQSADTP